MDECLRTRSEPPYSPHPQASARRIQQVMVVTKTKVKFTHGFCSISIFLLLAGGGGQSIVYIIFLVIGFVALWSVGTLGVGWFVEILRPHLVLGRLAKKLLHNLKLTLLRLRLCHHHHLLDSARQGLRMWRVRRLTPCPQALVQVCNPP